MMAKLHKEKSQQAKGIKQYEKVLEFCAALKLSLR